MKQGTFFQQDEKLIDALQDRIRELELINDSRLQYISGIQKILKREGYVWVTDHWEKKRK